MASSMALRAARAALRVQHDRQVGREKDGIEGEQRFVAQPRVRIGEAITEVSTLGAPKS